MLQTVSWASDRPTAYAALAKPNSDKQYRRFDAKPIKLSLNVQLEYYAEQINKAHVWVWGFCPQKIFPTLNRHQLCQYLPDPSENEVSFHCTDFAATSVRLERILPVYEWHGGRRNNTSD